MRFFKNIFVVVFSFVCLNLYSQEINSFGLAPNLNSDKSVINKIPNPNISNSGNLRADIAYACYLLTQTSENKFASLPMPSGVPLTDIGMGFGSTVTQCADFGPNGLLYAVSSPNIFVTINLTTGARSTIGNISGTVGTITSLAYNALTDKMYLGTTTGEISRLYSINYSTGFCTLIGTVTNTTILITMAINCEGKAYGIDISSDNLISINLLTGAGTPIGNIGFNANFLQDSDFDPVTGIYYLSAYNGSSSTGELRSVNLTTGMSTLINSWGVGVEVTGFAIPGACFYQRDVSAGPFISFPDLFVVNNNYNIKSVISNPGLTNQNNFPVKFFINGTQVLSQNLSLNTGQSDSISFNWNPTTTGSYNLKVVTALVDDENRLNDTVFANVQVFGSGYITLFCDNFENGLSAWNIVNNGGNCIWETFNPPYPNTYELPVSATGKVLSADSDVCGQSSNLNSTITLIDNINCLGKENVILEWDNDWRALPLGRAKVEVSYNGGQNWNTVVEWYGVSKRNSHEAFLLPGASNNPSVKIRFVSEQPGWSWWWVVDNVCLKGNIILNYSNNGSEIPDKFELLQNYPNPFNPTTKISFSIPENGFVSLKIFDLAGKEVTTLVNDFKIAGRFVYNFNGTSLPSGVYFYRLESNNFSEVKKMLLIK